MKRVPELLRGSGTGGREQSKCKVYVCAPSVFRKVCVCGGVGRQERGRLLAAIAFTGAESRFAALRSGFLISDAARSEYLPVLFLPVLFPRSVFRPGDVVQHPGMFSLNRQRPS